MSGWTHRICGECYGKKHPERMPVRVLGDPGGVCCFCGKDAGGGIFVRADPRTINCKGKGPEHEDSEP